MIYHLNYTSGKTEKLTKRSFSPKLLYNVDIFNFLLTFQQKNDCIASETPLGSRSTTLII